MTKFKIDMLWSIIVALVFVVAVIAATLLIPVYSFTIKHETVTIDDKWVKQSGSDTKYLVSSTDGQVFQIRDTILYWRFDSSNLYAKIKPGQTCYVTTQGFRFKMVSLYKNIVNAGCDGK